MTHQEPTLWEYVAPADRETLIAGTLAWLLDPNGSHGLGNRVITWLFDEVDLALPDLEQLRIRPEASDGRDRRFDILVDSGSEGDSIVLEVKTKTSGSDRQLRKYAETVDHVFRIGFEEWNYFDLDDSARDEFPLLRFSDFSEIVEDILREQHIRHEVFLQSFLEHLNREYELLRGIRDFFIRETTDTRPTAPTVHRYSERHLNTLYWRWFLDRWQDDDPSGSDWDIGSDPSGVWMSNWSSKIEIPDGQELRLPGVNLALPGPFKYKIHVEIWNKRSVLESGSEELGVLRIQVDPDRPEGKAVQLYEAVTRRSEDLGKQGFRPPYRRPSSGQNSTVLKRPLTIEELRYSTLSQLLASFAQPVV